MNITETLKQTIDELRIDERVEALSQEITEAYAQSRESLGGYVASRHDEITGLIEKVAATLDSRTEGRFAGEIGKLADVARRGVTRVAEQDGDTAS